MIILIDNGYLLSKDQGPEDLALVIARGNLVYWHFSGSWSDGVRECWAENRKKVKSAFISVFQYSITPLLHYSITPSTMIKGE